MSDLQWHEKKIKQTYIDFFKAEGHTFWPSTILFTNDGTNQPAFLSTDAAYTELSELKRACYIHKCIRAGGNYTDLQHVGVHDYPHTLYEILGNWSCEDDLKKVYGLCADQIYVSYFGGDEKAGLQPDNEAKDLWLKFLPSQRVLPFGYSDNFWEMEGTGPCGPCTEIHYDRIGNRDAASLVNNKEDRTCVPIWNLVFIQQLVLDLKNPCLRNKSLQELMTSVELNEDWHQDLAPLIWFSKGTFSLLVADLSSTYNRLNDKILLTWARSNHLARVLGLFKYLAEHKDTRVQLTRSKIHHYVYPFVYDVKTTEPVEFLREASLGFLEVYADADARNHVNTLLYSEIIPLCLRAWWVGSVPAKESIISIIEKILGNEAGIKHITSDEQRLFDLVFGLMMMVGQLSVNETPVKILKTLIRCYVLLAKNPRGRHAVRFYFPPSLLDGALLPVIAGAPEQESLRWLLGNL